MKITILDQATVIERDDRLYNLRINCQGEVAAFEVPFINLDDPEEETCSAGQAAANKYLTKLQRRIGGE